jgi:type IV secretory pathway TraG/TraD family ATPase VirD4
MLFNRGSDSVKAPVFSNATFAPRKSIEAYYPTLPVSKGGFRLGEAEVSLPERCQHLGFIGGTGVGKTSMVMIPNLIRDMHAQVSSVFSDKKHPEMYNTLCAVHDSLSKSLPDYKRIFACFAPFDLPNTIKWNPINDVETIGEAKSWADIIIKNSSGARQTSSEGTAFYKGIETGLLESLILFVNNQSYREKKRNNLTAVRKLLSLPQEGPKGRKSETNQLQSKLMDKSFTIADEVSKEIVPVWQVIRDRVQRFFRLDTDKMTGILEGLSNRMAVFSDPRVAFATSETELPLSLLCNEPITLILGVPSSEGDKAKVITALFWEGLIKNIRQVAAKSPRLLCPVFVCCYMDEAGNQGFFDFPQWLTDIRSYNAGFVYAFQSLDQIKEVWGDKGYGIVMDNTQNQVVFYGCGVDASAYFSQKAGMTTYRTTTSSESITKKAFTLIPSYSKGERDQDKQEALIPAHVFQKMSEESGEVGLKYHTDFWGNPKIDEYDRKMIKQLQGIAFLFNAPGPTWITLHPYYRDPYIMGLINGGTVTQLRDKLGHATTERMVEILQWNINEKTTSVPVVKKTEEPAKPTKTKKTEVVVPEPKATQGELLPTKREVICPICKDAAALLVLRPDLKAGGTFYKCPLNKAHKFTPEEIGELK